MGDNRERKKKFTNQSTFSAYVFDTKTCSNIAYSREATLQHTMNEEQTRNVSQNSFDG